MKMRFFVAALAVAGVLMSAGTASAQATTYTFQSPLYTTIFNSGGCTVGECATYTAAQRATVALTFAVPLAPNLANTDVSALVTSFTTDDGVRTTVGPSAQSAISEARATTDGAGTVTDFLVWVQRTPGPPYPVNTPADPNSRVSYVYLDVAGGTADVWGNAVCLVRGAPSAGSPPHTCTFMVADADESEAGATGVITVSAAPAMAPVPTLSTWAMILFALMLAGGAAVIVQRRRRA